MDSSKAVSTKATNQDEGIQTLKFICNDTISRIKWMPRFAAMKNLLAVAKDTFYGSNDEGGNFPPVRISYIDDEDDTVRVTSRPELMEAINNTIQRGSKTLRFIVSKAVAEEPQEAPPEGEDQGTSSGTDSDDTSEFDIPELATEGEDHPAEGRHRNHHGHRRLKFCRRFIGKTMKGIKGSLHALRKDTKKSKSLKKIKLAIKKHAKRVRRSLTETWKSMKSEVDAWKRSHGHNCRGRGWRHRQWVHWRNRVENGCPSDEAKDHQPPSDPSADEKQEQIHCINLVSLESRQRLGPNPKFEQNGEDSQPRGIPAVHAKRGKGSWGKLILETPSKELLESKPAIDCNEQAFLLKSLPTGKYLSMKSVDEKQLPSLRFDGNGKTKDCLFKFEVSTNERHLRICCEEKDSLIVSLVSLACSHTVHCDTAGEVYLKDICDGTRASFFEKIHCVHQVRQGAGKRQGKKMSSKQRKQDCPRKGWRSHDKDFDAYHYSPHRESAPFHHPCYHGMHHRGPHPELYMHHPHGPTPHHPGPRFWQHQHQVSPSQGSTVHHHEPGPQRKGDTPRAQIEGVNDGGSTTVRPGQAVQKTWTFRNTCAEPWSPDFGLSHLRGPNLTETNASIIPIGQTVLPGTTVTITMKMVAPPIPGRYCSYWRMTDASGSYFGPRVWSSVTVIQ